MVSTLHFGKAHNQKPHESESAGFLFWAPGVQNRLKKDFSHKIRYNYITNKNKSVSGYINKIQKINLPTLTHGFLKVHGGVHIVLCIFVDPF